MPETRLREPTYVRRSAMHYALRGVWLGFAALLVWAAGDRALALHRAWQVLSQVAANEAPPAPDALAPPWQELPLEGTTLRARSFLPNAPARAAVLWVQDVHSAGTSDPQGARWAAALQAQGVWVLAPEFESLQSDRLEPVVVEQLGQAARWLQRQHGAPVTLIGLGFGGGLAVRVASEPAFAESIRQVWSLGGHHDAAELMRGHSEEPSASPLESARGASAWGLTVALQAHAAECFAPHEQDAVLSLLAGTEPASPESSPPPGARWPDGARREELLALQHGERPERLRRCVREALVHHADFWAALGPAARLHQLQRPVWSWRAVEGGWIPPSQSAALAAGVGPWLRQSSNAPFASAQKLASATPLERTRWSWELAAALRELRAR